MARTGYLNIVSACRKAGQKEKAMAKKFWLVLLAIMLAFGMTVMGCDSGGSGGYCGCGFAECREFGDCSAQGCPAIPNVCHCD